LYPVSAGLSVEDASHPSLEGLTEDDVKAGGFRA